MNEAISPSEIPNIVNAPLSLGIRRGRLVSVSGMPSITPEGALGGVGDIRAQVDLALKNMSLVLHGGGATMADVIKTTVFLADIEDYEAMNEVYARHFPASCYPARSTIGVKLGHPDLLVEIEALAVLPD